MRRGALLAGALAAYIAYLVLGALLVARLERPHEDRLRAELQTLRQQLLQRSPCVAAPALDAFVERMLAAGRLGRAALANASGSANASDPAWDFASALFFASTLVTTVGTWSPSRTPDSGPPGAPASLGTQEPPRNTLIPADHSRSTLSPESPQNPPTRTWDPHSWASPPWGASIHAFPPSRKSTSSLGDQSHPQSTFRRASGASFLCLNSLGDPGLSSPLWA